MFIQVFIYFVVTLQRAILHCKNYFHFKADFIEGSSILISGWIDETFANKGKDFDAAIKTSLISKKEPTDG